MSQGITTSIRIPPELAKELQKTAHKLHRGKNWIIVKALEAFLAKNHENLLAQEARKQSLLAAKQDKEIDEDWLNNMDDAGWH